MVIIENTFFFFSFFFFLQQNNKVMNLSSSLGEWVPAMFFFSSHIYKGRQVQQLPVCFLVKGPGSLLRLETLLQKEKLFSSER